ncbi:MAG: hypothetical protein HY678_00705, partial [Chloroflexi bacterium]|nr:hypothetical protein [Chloroflexota bacterium]
MVVENYVRLAFHLNKHIDGLVDSYYGPAHLRGEVEKAPPMSPADLRDWARELRRSVAGEIEDGNRRHFLQKQLDSLAAQADRLVGTSYPYLDYVKVLFDITPERVEGAEMARLGDEVRRLLERAGYAGDTAEAVQRWEESRRIPPEDVVEKITQMADEARQRARQLVPLPAEESVAVVGVTDKPWNAYNWFLGGYRSRIEVNLDVPISTFHARHLVHHEMYPGHHTDHSCHELICYHQKGMLEPSVELINTPRSAVVEGLANTCHLFIEEAEKASVEQQLYEA